MGKRLPDVAYEIIKKKIVNGEFSPSQRLVEGQLSDSLSLGRHNVRAALQRLEQDGLVVIEPNRGASVASITLHEALDTLVARQELEKAVARRAALSITDEQIANLETYVERMRECLEHHNFDEYSVTNREFHRVIYSACGNRSMPWLISMLREKMARLQLRTILIPGRSDSSLAEHTAIYEALAHRDPGKTEKALSDHIGNLARTVEKAWNLVRT